MDQNKLNELEAAEADAKDAYREARAFANAARITLGEQTLEGMGVVLGSTVCSAGRWESFSDLDRVVVERVTIDGRAWCRPVTKGNKVHAGKKAFAVDIEKIKVEGE